MLYYNREIGKLRAQALAKKLEGLKQSYMLGYIVIPKIIMFVSHTDRLKKIYRDKNKPNKYRNEAWYDFFSMFKRKTAFVVSTLILCALLFAALIPATLGIFFQENKKQYATDILVGAKNVSAAFLHNCVRILIIIATVPIKIGCIPFRALSKKEPATLEESDSFQLALKKLEEKEESITSNAVEPNDTIEIQAALNTLKYKIVKALVYGQTSAHPSDQVIRAHQQLQAIQLGQTASDIKNDLRACSQALSLFKTAPTSTTEKKRLTLNPSF